jgi:hypothetical protein
MTFMIEEDVPLPKRQGGRTGSKYPFAVLETGQSFMVPDDAEKAVNVGTLRSALGAFNKRNPGSGKFSVRKVEGGVRVWRME